MGPYGSAPGRGPAAKDRPLIPIAPILEHFGAELGADRWGEQQICCPIHKERRPSMRVNAERGVFFCHGCGAGGSAVHLIMAMEHCEYSDALERAEKITREAGHEVKSETKGRYQRPGADRPTVRTRRYVPPGRR